ncbi:MAG: polyphosphate:AMP phosphotransferase [Nitrospiraceae bacterium]|nr:polyphosphate:AMP phosphotransferase [Nitrospiraceae bacterium]
MLDDVNLKAKLSKADFKKAKEAFEQKLPQLQRDLRGAGIPVIVVFEGWHAAGVGTAIGRILRCLDPRGYSLHNFQEPDEEEALRPPMWRFWVSLPSNGEIAVYDGSWYSPAMEADAHEREEIAERARVFERQLVDDGAVLVKFWMHVSQQEQARRFSKMQEKADLSWRVTKEDWRENQHYAENAKAIDKVLKETSTPEAPWTVIPSHDSRYANLRAIETLMDAMERALKHKRPKQAKKAAKKAVKKARRGSSPLDKVDLDVTIERERYDRQLSRLQKRLLRLEHQMYLPRIPVVVMYEGWDAGGKGGNIKRLIGGLDHRGVRVIPVAAPEGDEKTHHYLWRFWKHLPKAGHLTVFDRSWYGRVLVERVEGFARPEEWQRAYQEIREFEKQLTSFGTVLVKFWIHISKKEQLKRFTLRQNTPYKQWKITDEDWRNRERWDQYYEAVSDMIEKTSTRNAPWTIIEGNQKLYARIKALKTVCAAVDAALDAARHGDKRYWR